MGSRFEILAPALSQIEQHTHTRARATALFVLFTTLFHVPIATVCPDVLVSLRNLIRGLVCVLFVEIICEGACLRVRCFHMSRDLSKPHATLWKNVRCYVTTIVLLGYICPSIRFNLNLCSSVGDETCQQTRTISLSIMRSHFAYLRKSACK